MNELRLFRLGHDTQTIAGFTRRTEAEVYNKLSRMRETERRRAELTYRPDTPKPAPPKLLKYAGHDPRYHDEWERL